MFIYTYTKLIIAMAHVIVAGLQGKVVIVAGLQGKVVIVAGLQGKVVIVAGLLTL